MSVAVGLTYGLLVRGVFAVKVLGMDLSVGVMKGKCLSPWEMGAFAP